jgi:hypothetical protein
MGGPRRIHHAVQQEQTRPFFVLPGCEDHISSGAVVASPRERSLNILRAAKLFRTGSHVEGMQALVVIS